jgi:hypothetical protein
MSDNSSVLIVRSSSDIGSATVSKAFEKVTALFGLRAEICDYENIVLPNDEIKRFPPEAGSEWSVKQADETRKQLSEYQVYVLLALSDNSSSSALKMLTLRGENRIFGKKQVVIVDPERRISSGGFPSILGLIDQNGRFTTLQEYFKLQNNKDKIGKLFTRLMSEVYHSDRP